MKALYQARGALPQELSVPHIWLRASRVVVWGSGCVVWDVVFRVQGVEVWDLRFGVCICTFC